MGTVNTVLVTKSIQNFEVFSKLVKQALVTQVRQAFVDRFKLCLLNAKDKINHNNYVLYCIVYLL
jgi:hypothetical protein